MRIIPALGTVALTVLLTACGSSTGTTGPSSAPPPASPTITAPASPSGSATCKDLEAVASQLGDLVHYVALNVGTTNSSLEYYPRIDQAMATMTDLAPTCAPDAVTELAALQKALTEMMARMVPGTDEATIQADVAALAKVRAAGVAAWKAMDLPIATWENRPENRVS